MRKYFKFQNLTVKTLFRKFQIVLFLFFKTFKYLSKVFKTLSIFTTILCCFRAQLTITFGVNKVVKLESDGTLQVKSTISLVWNDTDWSWFTNTDSDWDLPETILVPAGDLWTPRFQLANCESENCVIAAANKTRVIITNVGTVLLIIEPLVTASCEMDFRLFPFDNQTCKLEFQMPDHLIVDDYGQSGVNETTKFANDVLSDLQIDLQPDTQLLSTAYASDEWLLRDVSVGFTDFQFNVYKKVNSTWKIQDEELEIHRSGFVVQLSVHRHAGYFVSNLIVPLFIVQVCGLFTVLLPGTSDGRLNLAVTVLLGFIFVQTITASVMPKSDDNPLVSQYIIGALVLSVFNLATCAICSSIASFPAENAPPPVIRFFAHHPKELFFLLCPRRGLLRLLRRYRQSRAPAAGAQDTLLQTQSPVNMASPPVNFAAIHSTVSENGSRTTAEM